MEEREITTLVRTTRGLIREARRAEVVVLVTLPPHRKDVPEPLKDKASARLHRMIVEEGGIPFKMEGQLGRTTYINQLARDDIHYKNEHWRIVLGNMLMDLQLDGAEIRFPGEKVTLAEAFPRLCQICGVKHPKGRHADYIKCTSCNRGNHAENVCLTAIQMCRGCGRRGHILKKCDREYQR